MSYAYHDLNGELVFKRLLSFGLFPDGFEGIFTSEHFGNLIANERGNTCLDLSGEKFSLLKFKLTRNNNVPRYMGIPHPLAYTQLCECIEENWDKIDERIGKDNEHYISTSMVIPRDNDERRLVIIQKYRQPDEEGVEIMETRLIDRGLRDISSNLNILTKQFGAKYIAYTDISGFFANIYSHALPWALVGKDISKRDRDKNKWFNKIDYCSRLMKNDETNGIPIGPDTSHILSEIILSQIDKGLSKYNFIRYIDDYHCYCKDREEAESFIKDVSQLLNAYQLELNERKTFIEKLPQPLIDNWIRAIQTFELNENSDTETIIHFLDLAVYLSNEKGDFSPFKFAIKRLGNSISNKQNSNILILYISNITLLHPYLIESMSLVIDKLIEVGDNVDELRLLIADFLSTLIIRHSSHGRSDVVVWGFFLAKKYNIQFGNYENIIHEIEKMNDPLAMLSSFAYSRGIGKYNLISFYNILENIDQTEWWLYVYELYLSDKEEFLRHIPEGIMLYKNYYNFLSENNISFLSENWNSLDNNEYSLDDILF